MHLVLEPLPIIVLPIRPVVLASAADLVTNELTLIVALVGKGQLSLPIFPSISILAFVLGSIWPHLDSKSLLLVINPVPVVVSSIRVGIGTLSVGFIA